MFHLIFYAGEFMTKLFDRLAKKHRLVTIETWSTFLYEESGEDSGAFYCYLDATNEMVDVLTGIVRTQKDFESLKEELLYFIEERRAFIKHGDNNHPD